MRKLRDADAMLNAGKDLAAVLQSLEVSESTLERWRGQYGGMKSEEAKRLKTLEDEKGRATMLAISVGPSSATTSGAGTSCSIGRRAAER